MIKKLILLTLILLPVLVKAQNGTLQGEVKSSNGDMLGFGNVHILGSTKGSFSRADGKYKITGIAPGRYSVLASVVGYAGQLAEVQINSNETTIQDFTLLDGATRLSEITIVAQKRDEELQKIPIALTTIGTKKIEALQINTINDIGRIAPNFKAFGDGGSFRTIFTSRGIASNEESSPTVGFYLDDMPLFSTNTFSADLYDVESIEVLRGAQGTLYGRNALAGVINIRTKPPGNTLKGFAKVGYGNLNSLSANAGISVPIVKDKLFAKIGINYFERDGYVNNTFLENETGDKETYGGNTMILFHPNESWSIKLSSSFDRRILGAFPYTSSTNLDSVKANSPYERISDKNNRYEIFSLSNTLNIKADFKKLSFTSITSHQYNTVKQFDEFDFTTFDIVSIDGDTKTNTISQEFRLASSQIRKLSWVSGVFLYSIPQERKGYVNFGTDIGFLIPPLAAIAPYRQFTNTEVDRNGFAVFGQTDYKLTPKLNLSTGIRLDYEKVTVNAHRSYVKDGGDFQLPDFGFVPTSFESDATFNAVSAKVGLNYQFTESKMMYAIVSRGFRPGGINSFVINENDIDYDPEYSWNYEIGYKSTWLDNRLRTNASLFYIDWRNQQVLTVFGIVDNIGRSQSYGAELEAEFIPVKGLTVRTNLGYQHVTTLEYQSKNPDTGEELNYNNKRGIFAPLCNTNIDVIYEFFQNKKYRPSIALDYGWQSETFFDLQNEVRQGSYGLLNVRVGISSKNIDAFLWTKNLTDRVYYSYGFNSGSGSNIALYGIPQTYGITVTTKF